MIERASYDLLRLALRIVVRLWPLWLFWFVWDRFSDWWLAYLLTFPDRSSASFAFAYRCWPTVALLGPILLMLGRSAPIACTSPPASCRSPASPVSWSPRF